MSRFAPTYSDRELLAIVRAVATHSNKAEPQSVTQAAYDAARAGAGHEDTPRAYRVAKRLGSSWAEVLRLACEAENPEKTVGVRRNSEPRATLTPAKIDYALNRVAGLLGTDGLSLDDYNEERERLVNEDEARWARGGEVRRLLPTGQNIVRFAGSWEHALVMANLKARQGDALPTYPADRALDDFVADYGFTPTRRMLLDYLAKRDLASPRLDERGLGMGFGEWVRDELANGLASRHSGVRIIKSVRSAPADWEDAPITAAPAGYRTAERRGVLTIADCEQSLTQALDIIGSDDLNQRVYGRLARTHGLVSLNGIQGACARDGNGLTWGKLLRRVIAERATVKRSQPRQRSRKSKKT